MNGWQAAATAVCVITGTVYDTEHRPVAGAKVSVNSVTVQTDAQGDYKASMPCGDGQPAFFDEPKYTAAGVTDFTYQGGHGSDAVFRSTKTIAEAVDKGSDYEKRASEAYSKGDYDEAARWFYKATDVDPKDPKPYLLLGEAKAKQITESSGYKERMARFVKLHPENEWANYYFGKTLPDERAQTFYQKALTLAPARVELGAIAARAHHYDEAIREYQAAIKMDPNLDEAHYRLAEAYRLKAKLEMDEFQRLSRH